MESTNLLSIINWGIIGPGKIGEKFASDLQLLPEARLLAIASRSQETARQFGDKFEVPFRYHSYEEMMQNPEVHVVYIATPHPYHYEHTMLCLKYGKAVLCEKPFAINSKQAGEMVMAAKSNHIFLMEALWTKFLPPFKKVAELVGNGTIGEIKTIQADFGFHSDFDPQSRLFNRNLGGGSLLDVGIYPLFLAISLLGRPDEIKAMANIGTSEVDENCGMILKYKTGAIATLLSSIVSHTTLTANIAGTKGRIFIHADWFRNSEITLYHDHLHPEKIQCPIEGNGFSYEAAEVMRCLRNGKVESDIMRHADSMMLMETMDRVRKDAGITYPGID